MFAVVTAVLLAVDLFIVNRRPHVMTVREATRWSAVVVATALLFGIVVHRASGPAAALDYYTGYLVELSLSVDNLFVFILIFQYFAVPAEAHSKVLNWGIFGAAIMRALMVVAGTAVLARFEWLFIVLGVLLLATAVRMMRAEDERIEPERNPLVRLARRFLPMTPAYEGTSFVVQSRRGWLATPLVLVVLVIEWTDVVFAIDSIPAIFAITRDPFIVYSSNLFAVVGLRAMFFVIADAMQKFRYLKPAVGLILIFIGIKMVLFRWVHIPSQASLAVVLALLAGGVVLSLRQARAAD
ncbi:MAG: TerC/Alx family metal homeostasis membrane protein [Gemmatimonadales bacterium]